MKWPAKLKTGEPRHVFFVRFAVLAALYWVKGKMTDTQTLLAEYVNSGSEGAFGELVARYINLVYSTALRRTDGDADLAKDVSQTVFIDLAQKAGGLSKEVMLGGWLHQRACHVAAALMRSERRRRTRERQAMAINDGQQHTEFNLAQIASTLDEAIGQLATEDRTVLLLRFFEQHDFRSLGAIIGTSEDAARMRTTRALEKLQAILKRRGAAFSVGSLTSALGAAAATSAPAGLAACITGTALASAGTAGTTTTLISFLTMSKAKLGLIGALAVAGLATPLTLQTVHQSQLRTENEALRAQVEHAAQLRVENERLSNLFAQSAASHSLTGDQSRELLRLRGEVAVLKRQLAESARAQKKPAETPQQAASGNTSEELFEQAGLAKMTYARNWLLAFHLFAEENRNQFPTNFDQALPFLPEEARTEHNLQPHEYPPETPKYGLTPDRFEIVYRGSIAALTSPQSTIVFREREPWQKPDGSWVRTYGFADGHTEIYKAADGNFEPWERQRMVVAAQGR